MALQICYFHLKYWPLVVVIMTMIIFITIITIDGISNDVHNGKDN